MVTLEVTASARFCRPPGDESLNGAQLFVRHLEEVPGALMLLQKGAHTRVGAIPDRRHQERANLARNSNQTRSHPEHGHTNPAPAQPTHKLALLQATREGARAGSVMMASVIVVFVVFTVGIMAMVSGGIFAEDPKSPPSQRAAAEKLLSQRADPASTPPSRLPPQGRNSPLASSTRVQEPPPQLQPKPQQQPPSQPQQQNSMRQAGPSAPSSETALEDPIPLLCTALPVSRGDAWCAVNVSSLMAGLGSVDILGASGAPRLRANFRTDANQETVIDIAMNATRSATLASIFKAQARDGAGKLPTLELTSLGGNRYGELRPLSNGNYVLQHTGRSVLSFQKGPHGDLTVTRATDNQGAIISSVTQGSARDFFKGQMHFEVRVTKGYESVLVLLCVLGIAFFTGLPIQSPGGSPVA